MQRRDANHQPLSEFELTVALVQRDGGPPIGRQLQARLPHAGADLDHTIEAVTLAGQKVDQRLTMR
jgi:hypothetical protein